MNNSEIIGLYLLGWIPILFVGFMLGMKYCDRLWRKSVSNKVMEAYSRGWNHGYGFLTKIEDAKTEHISGVIIHAEKASQE